MIFRCHRCARLNRVDPDREGAKCGGCKSALRLDGHPGTVDDDALQRLVASSPVPVLVDFYADWCGPCRALSPVLEQLAAAHRGDLIVVKVDTERSPRMAAELGVRGIPAVFLFKDGRKVADASGMRPLPAWEAMVRPHLPPGP